MASNSDIRKAVKEFAARVFKSEQIDTVLVEPDIGAIGTEILRISVVFKKRPKRKLRADDKAKLRNSTISYLEDAGDERFPVVTYMTADELNQINAINAGR